MEKNVIRIEAEPTREDANRIIAERREAVRAYVLEKLKETKTATPASDLLFGLFPIQEGNPYREIVNISAYVSPQCRRRGGCFSRWNTCAASWPS